MDESSSSPPATRPGSDPNRVDIFATTHWTVVIAAGRRHTPESDAALEKLCQSYWFPLYAYVRRRGYSKEDAEDLTQAFFARFLEKNFLVGLDAERGRFRAFLLAALKHFLANEWDKSQRQKRGGNITHLSLDWQTADTQFNVAANTTTPEKEFDREWAITLLEKVLGRLEAEAEQAGRAAQFAKLKVFLSAAKRTAPYADVARETGMDEGAVRVAVHRLRKRYRQLVIEEVAQTVSGPAQVDEEMRALFAAFS